MEFEADVQNVITRARKVKSFRFQRPASFDYKPGQFMYIKIKSESKELLKHFTISSSPSEDYLEFTKKLTGSDFSNALDALKVGDKVGINGPFGFFAFEGEFEKIGILTGGIGITPFRSMVRYCTDKQMVTNIILLYGNHCEKDIVFTTELEEIQEQNKNFKVIFTLSVPDDGWTGRRGRINRDMVKTEIPDYKERMFYIAGPSPMVKAMDNLLQELNLPPGQVKKEDFPGYEKLKIYSD
jgi:ferredoxin-NADP reductase